MRLHRLCHLPIVRPVAALLMTLVCSVAAFPAAVHDAARDGRLAEVEVLLKNDPDLVFSKDSNGYTPLLLAAANGRLDIAELLLANKAEVDAKGHDGLTPLYMATLFGHAKVMELLIARGADVNVKDKDGKTPLQLVTAAGRKELVELLVAHGARESREEENQGLPDIVCRFRWKRLEVSPDGIVRDADGKVTKLAVGNTDIEMQTDVVGFEYWYVVVFTKRYGKLRVKMNSDLTGRVVLTPDQKAAFMKLGK